MKTLAFLAALLASTAALAQQTSGLPVLYPSTPAQITSYDGTARSITARSFNGGVIRLLCTTDCLVAIGQTPLASTTTGLFLYQNTSNWFLIRRNERVSVIQSSSGGTIHLQEFAR